MRACHSAGQECLMGISISPSVAERGRAVGEGTRLGGLTIAIIRGPNPRAGRLQVWSEPFQ